MLDDQALRERLRALAHERRRFGYRRLDQCSWAMESDKNRGLFPSNRLVGPPTRARLGQLGGQDAEQRYGHKASPPKGASRLHGYIQYCGVD
jgi:hypothetical protein